MPRKFLSAYPEFSAFPQFIILEPDGSYVANRSTKGLESETVKWSFREDLVLDFLREYAPRPLPNVRPPPPPRIVEVPE